jgi:hypothetical protein
MNRCYHFSAIGSSGATSTSLSRWDPLTQLIRRHKSTHRRFIRCWRTPRQNQIVCIFETIGWTAAPPSVLPALKLQSWRVSILIQTKRQIDRRCPHLDRRIIRCYCLLQLSSLQSSDTITKWTVGSSDGANCIWPSAQCTKCTDSCTEGRVPSVHLTVSISFLFFRSFDPWNINYLLILACGIFASMDLEMSTRTC